MSLQTNFYGPAIEQDDYFIATQAYELDSLLCSCHMDVFSVMAIMHILTGCGHYNLMVCYYCEVINCVLLLLIDFVLLYC